jgi:hypothetical protein
MQRTSTSVRFTPSMIHIASRYALLVALALPSALLAAELVPSIQIAQQASGTQPSSVEIDYWRSVERLGTSDAYRAYLASYPSGFFSGLAKAALSKSEGLSRSPQKNVAPVDRSMAGPPDSAMLSRIAAEAPSGAVTFSIGDVFLGPGTLTVGRFGAKKQFVVPNGHWVVLAAIDQYSPTVPRVSMAAIALGKLEGNLVRSILTAEFDTVPSRAVSQWVDLKSCNREEPYLRFYWRNDSPQVRQCVIAKAFLKPAGADFWNENLWRDVRVSVSRLGVLLPEEKTLRTDIFTSDTGSGYLRIGRYDFGAPDTNRPEIDFGLDARTHWAKEYATWAMAGFSRTISSGDLVAGGRASESAIRLPD